MFASHSCKDLFTNFFFGMVVPRMVDVFVEGTWKQNLLKVFEGFRHHSQLYTSSVPLWSLRLTKERLTSINWNP